ncbi:DUF732 domain-containing protein [Mycobacterium arosiense]|uniref:DUF732 domain-containing protein n=1 Tax=Mycobacterium arosiense ATCC BAA-1401 = DSM 45069 TaxID=1265311 RepID=A0A1W9ZC83_MYCAI|nr:DUF732 domain-containing protein [Mycobacterium arosiense]ORA11906.1 hypothetical protein BST14_17995 [Mycobacterium arosiense ATCC BAA-1401 = DSM 45069]
MFTGITRSTGVTSHGHFGTLVTAVLVLTGAAILRGGAAAADPNQDDQFLAFLDQEGIPALEGVPYLVDTAHKVCRAVDAGFSASQVVDAMVQFAYSQDPTERNYAPGRLARTEARFVRASVNAYCPYDRGKLASLVTDPASFSGKAQPRVVLAHNVIPSGEIIQPIPPEIPSPPPPPAAHLRTPPQPIAAPPRPQQSAPRPQQSAPVPQRPAPAPPEQPAPAPEQLPPAPPQSAPPPPPPPPAAPPMAPGFVRLAP